MLKEILQSEFLENTVADYLLALAVVVVGVVCVKIVRGVIIKRLKRWATKTATHLDDSIIRIIEGSLIPAVYLGLFYIAVSNLTLHPILQKALNVICIIIGTILGIRLLVSLAEYFIRVYMLTRAGADSAKIDLTINALVPAIRAIVWAIGLVFLIDNLGFDISAVVASLGVGGVAIALASQGILQDLFSYFSILFDRPFELGDFIIVGDCMGSVEHVGIKTTRLNSLSGEEIIIANTDLTGSRIRNYKRMARRRVAFKIGVIYETSLQQLQAIPSIVKTVVEETEHVIFDRTHFSDYGDFSLNFEIVYYVLSNDYNQYMDAQQQINLKLKQEFEKQSIEFAYPTHLTYFKTSLNGQSDQSTANFIAARDGSSFES